MKRAVRAAGFVLAGAIWLLLMLASAASADIVDPGSPFTPSHPTIASPKAIPSPHVPVAPLSAPAEASAAEPAPEPSPAAAPAATPAPVMQAPPADAPDLEKAPPPIRARAAQRSAAAARATAVAPIGSEERPLEPVIQFVRERAVDVGVFLAEVASACKVGMSAGAGGPVLVLAVLGVAAALEGRRILRGRWATDEKLPEHLYAWDVIAPG